MMMINNKTDKQKIIHEQEMDKGKGIQQQNITHQLHLFKEIQSKNSH